MMIRITTFLLTLTVAAGLSAQVRDSRLAEATANDDHAAITSLLKQKADVNGATADGMTALHWASFHDDVALAKTLIAAGANVKATTRVGDITPLFMAATNGSAPMIDLLLKSGADANSTKANGTTVLMIAAKAGNPDAVKLLLDKGANVNAKESAHGQTALMFAASVNRAEVIRLLAKRGADLNVTSSVSKLVRMRFDEDGNPIGPAAEDPKGTVPSAATANRAGATAMGGLTALIYAAREGHTDAVQALIESGANVNTVADGDKTSALVMAIENGHFTLAKYLLDKGADPNLASTQGLAALYATIDAQYAPLGWAPNPVTAQEKVTHLELMKALLDKGADPNGRLAQKLWFRPLTHDQQWIGPAGATPLWRAAVSSDVAAIKLLVQYKADPNIATLGGDTPLMVGAGLGWGANFTINVPDQWLATVKYLVEDLHCDVNAKDSQNYTALHGAAYRGDNEVVQYLIDHGAKTDVRSKKGQAVTDMANGAKVNAHLPIEHPETIALLMKHGAPKPDPNLEAGAVVQPRTPAKDPAPKP